MKKILCFFGIHRWKHDLLGTDRGLYQLRVCQRCWKTQRLEFYSNRSQEWMDVNVHP